MRQAVALAVLGGRSETKIRALGQEYHQQTLRHTVRPEAERRLAWHVDRGHTVCVVSASLDFYLEPWCKERGVGLICSRIAARGGRLTGLYAGRDCTGTEKARRARQLGLDHYDKIYVYGDTTEDDELLALGHESFRCWPLVPISRIRR